MNGNTPIVMYNGIIKIVKNIKNGDKIMGLDSNPKIVKDIIKNNDILYDIIPIKGMNWSIQQDQKLVFKVRNIENITWDNTKQGYMIKWLEYTKNPFNFSIRTKRFPEKKYISNESCCEAALQYLTDKVPTLSNYIKCDDIISITMQNYNKLNNSTKLVLKIFNTGIEFPNQEINLDPYILGYWLGDGSSRTTEITTADQEIVEYFTKFAKKHDLEIRKKDKYSYYISTGTKFGPKDRNHFMNCLRQYNLLNNKHIPDVYKYNTREIRLHVLAGLLDSDGYCHNTYFEIVQKSEKLIDDIIYLSRSLGFSCNKVGTEKTCTNAPNGPKSGIYYRINIYGKTEELKKIPLLLVRKNIKHKLLRFNTQLRKINIEQKKEIETYYKLEFEKPTKILLSDFTVIHN